MVNSFTYTVKLFMSLSHYLIVLFTADVLLRIPSLNRNDPIFLQHASLVAQSSQFWCLVLSSLVFLHVNCV